MLQWYPMTKQLGGLNVGVQNISFAVFSEVVYGDAMLAPCVLSQSIPSTEKVHPSLQKADSLGGNHIEKQTKKKKTTTPKPKNQQLSFGTHKQLHIFELVCFIWGW